MVSKADLRMAKRIWATQNRHPKKTFVGKDFTNKGTLTNQGKKKIMK